MYECELRIETPKTDVQSLVTNLWSEGTRLQKCKFDLGTVKVSFADPDTLLEQPHSCLTLTLCQAS